MVILTAESAGEGVKSVKEKWIGPYFGGLVAVGASFAAMWAAGSLLSRVSYPLPRCLADSAPYLLSVAAGIAVLMIFSAILRGRMIPRAERPSGRPFMPFAVFLTLFLFLSAAGLISSLMSGDASVAEIYKTMNDGDFAVTALLGTVVYPLAEEALFRRGYLGILAGDGAPAAADGAAVAIQSVLFASVHPAGSRVFAFAAGAALGIGALASMRRSGLRFPWICAAAHGAYNMSVYAALALWRRNGVSPLNLAAYFTGVAALALGVVILIRAKRGKKLFY